MQTICICDHITLKKKKKAADFSAASIRGRPAAEALLRQSALMIASALETSKAPGFSTFSALTTPSSTIIA